MTFVNQPYLSEEIQLLTKGKEDVSATNTEVNFVRRFAVKLTVYTCQKALNRALSGLGCSHARYEIMRFGEAVNCFMERGRAGYDWLWHLW